MSEITKQKAGKPDWMLLIGPLRNALEAMVRVREYGNGKYSKIAADAGVPFDSESWRDNDVGTYLASAQRHMVAAMSGERVNEQDGGCEHMAQAMIDLGFALEIERQGGPRRKAGAPSSDAYMWTEVGDVVLGSATQRLVIRHRDDLPSLYHMVDVLSRKKRWSDQFEDAISVTRHCIMVASITNRLSQSTCSAPKLIRSALAHDLHEAIYGDLATPHKRLYRAMLPEGVALPHDTLCAQFDRILSEEYALNLADPLIKQADDIAACAEAFALGIPSRALEHFFSEDSINWALRINPMPHCAWPAQDDAAQWWAMWENARC